MSLANLFAVSYRRSLSLAIAYITIQSSSPLTKRPSFAGSEGERVITRLVLSYLGYGA
jgi:hypothetical protein